MKLSHRVAVTAAAMFVSVTSVTSLAAQSSSRSVTAADQKAPPADAASTNPNANANIATATQNAVPSQAPFADNATVGVKQLAPNAPVPYTPPRDGTKNQGVALMIVGGAALLAGAIIGNTGGNVIMVGGIVVGAIGLYKYLQ